MAVQLLFCGILLLGFFSLTRSIPVEFLASFFFIHLVSVYVVHAYNRIDTTAA